jgi:hypothetical protein
MKMNTEADETKKGIKNQRGNSKEICFDQFSQNISQIKLYLGILLVLAFGGIIAISITGYLILREFPSPDEKISQNEYVYEFEYVNVRNQCEPDDDTWGTLYFFAAGWIDDIDDNEMMDAIEKAMGVNNCIRNELNNHMSGHGEDGWKLISIETMDPVEYDLGFEYVYRLVWERTVSK